MSHILLPLVLFLAHGNSQDSDINQSSHFLHIAIIPSSCISNFHNNLSTEQSIEIKEILGIKSFNNQAYLTKMFKQGEPRKSNNQTTVAYASMLKIICPLLSPKTIRNSSLVDFNLQLSTQKVQPVLLVLGQCSESNIVYNGFNSP